MRFGILWGEIDTTVISPGLIFVAAEGLPAIPVNAEITVKNINVRSEPNTKGKRLAWLQTSDETCP